MIEEIYLVRHGRVYKEGNKKFKLNEEGTRLSKMLPKVLKNREIDFILCDKKDRCKETIIHLKNDRELTPDYKEKKYFELKRILKDYSQYGSLLICYGAESIYDIQSELETDALNEYIGEHLYDFIFCMKNKDNKWYLSEKIPLNLEG